MRNLCAPAKDPSSRLRQESTKYPFDQPKPGEGFFLPGRPEINLSNLASVTGKRLGKNSRLGIAIGIAI